MWGTVRSWTFECMDCDWRKTTSPGGDVLLHGVTYFDACPACGGEHVMRREATELERLVERLMPKRRLAS
jgi:predicted RNA-binding Zn-ribbon protein involved in translation (DUF1610 family)